MGTTLPLPFSFVFTFTMRFEDFMGMKIQVVIFIPEDGGSKDLHHYMTSQPRRPLREFELTGNIWNT
jgi:hypothetical protein